MKAKSKNTKGKTTKSKTTKSNKNKTKKHKKITDLEIQNCDKMCRTTYLDYKKKFVKKFLVTNLSDKELDNRLNQNKENFILDCKDIFCNPKCNEKRTLRYVCPVCKKREKQSKKYGAITFCKHTSVFP